MTANRAQMRALGHGERLLRLWDFYLAFCEGGFLERAIHTVQMKLERASA